MKTIVRNSVILVSLFGTVGFTDFFFKGDPEEEVSDYINEVQNTMKPNDQLKGMEPPELKAYQAYRVIAKNEDPFLLKSFVRRPGSEEDPDEICQDSNCGDGPPLNHAKYFLENYSLDRLTMIGSVKFTNGKRVALILTPDLGVVRAAPGEYIGQNHGLVLTVEKNRLILREKYRSPKGWQDRMAKLPLTK